MKKMIYSLAATLMLAASVFVMFPKSAQAAGEDHEGYKKVFLRQHCKAASNYICRLSDPPVIVIKL